MEAITPQQIQKIVPKTPKPAANAMAFYCRLMYAFNGISDVRKQAAYIAQMVFESNGLTIPSFNRVRRLWNSGNCNSDANDFRAITRVFTPNLEGYGARLLIYKQALRVLNAH